MDFAFCSIYLLAVECRLHMMLCKLGRRFGSNRNMLYSFVLHKKYGKISNSLGCNKTSLRHKHTTRNLS